MAGWSGDGGRRNDGEVGGGNRRPGRRANNRMGEVGGGVTWRLGGQSTTVVGAGQHGVVARTPAAVGGGR